jgi:radical SAM protein with 4Fe4S-binding SPASM domain
MRNYRVTSRKRWKDIYAGDNPFQLVQTVARQIRTTAKNAETNGHKQLKYVWLYASSDGISDSSSEDERLSAQEWLSVVDEAASMGASYIVATLEDSLSKQPEVVELSEWAQTAHDMWVGLHFTPEALSMDGLDQLQRLDKEKTYLFVEEEEHPAAQELRKQGFMVCNAEGQDQETVSPECRLPEEMTCVGSQGTMYTCGLVMKDEDYRLGNFFENKLDRVMKDESLPHSVPEGYPKGGQKCNGCPPLMVRRMEQGRN